MILLENIWPEWQIIKEIGEGSFGKVYEIHREDIGGTYKAALKVINIPKDKSEVDEIISEGMSHEHATRYFQGIVEEIVKEFALMEKLKGNTNVVSYEDHKVITHPDGVGWDILIRMELLTPLTEIIKTQILSENEVIKLGIDICKALELCGRYHVIHRDIKPENIFVSELGDYKLGDFGIARTVEKTIAGMSKKGTFTYMAPEVYKGEPYNATVDIYSLGIVLYRLLNNNRAPFLPSAPEMITFNDREAAQSRRLMGEPFPAPAHGSRQLVAVINRACAYTPKMRYSSAYEMRRALESVLREIDEEEEIWERTEIIEAFREDINDSGYEEEEYLEDIEDSKYEEDEYIEDKEYLEYEEDEAYIESIENKEVKKKESIQRKKYTKKKSSSNAFIISCFVLSGVLVSFLIYYLTGVGNGIYSDQEQDVLDTAVQNDEENEEANTTVIDEELEGDKCYFACDYVDAIKHYEAVGDNPRAWYKIALCYGGLWVGLSEDLKNLEGFEDFDLMDYEDVEKAEELLVSNIIHNIMFSAEGDYADAQALLAYMMDDNYQEYFSELHEYYDSEMQGYDYWMNLAKQNGYVEELPFVYDDRVTFKEQDMISEIYEYALKGSLRCCRLLIAAYFYDDRVLVEEMIPAALGITAEEMIANLNEVVFASEYDFGTLNVKTGYINGLAMYASLNHDYEMLELVRDEVDKIQQYMEQYASADYRSVALILAAESYNQNLDKGSSGNGFAQYLDLAELALPDGGDITDTFGIRFYMPCMDAIGILENKTTLYAGAETELATIQTEGEDFAVTAIWIFDAIDSDYVDDGWYEFLGMNIEACGVTDVVFIRTDDVKQIIGKVDATTENQNEIEDANELQDEIEGVESVNDNGTGQFLYDEARNMLNLVNQYRASSGLAELAWNPNREEWMRALASRQKTEWEPNDDFPSTLVSLGSDTASTAEIAFDEILARASRYTANDYLSPSRKLLDPYIDNMAVGCYYSPTAEYKYVWFMVIQVGDATP